MRVLINGITGKMGQAAEQAIRSQGDMSVVGGLRRHDSLAAAIQSTRPDVVVDLTHPSVGFDNTMTTLQHGVHAVVGTTGFTDAQLSIIHDTALSADRVAMIVPNFAIGAVMMMKAAADIVAIMPSVEIIEYHHHQKADSPSGTAIQTAHAMAAANPSLNPTPLDGPGRGQTVAGVPIHSVRLQGFVASQAVVFGELGQTLTIQHDTTSREAFMPGLLLCIRQVSSFKGMVYGLYPVLEQLKKEQ